MPSSSPSSSGSASPSTDCGAETPRVTANDVRCIMTDISPSITDEQIDCFIMAAHVIVENELVADENCSANNCTLFTVEQWLAAHLVATTDPATVSERYGDAQDTYEGKWGLGFDGSRYGQQVMRIDPCGKLSDINEQAKQLSRPLIFKAVGR